MTDFMKSLQDTVNALMLSGGNKAAAAGALGISPSTFKSRLARAMAAGIQPNITPPDQQSKVEKLKIYYEDRIRALEATVKTYVREELTCDYVRKHFFGLSEKPASTPKWLASSASLNVKNPGVPTVVFSDFHWGEVVNPLEVDGLNEYNLSIASQRFDRLIDKTVDLCKHHMVSPNYPGIVVILGGDMVSGDIHQELVETNEGQTMQHVFDLFEKLASGLSELADQFGRVFVPCTYGNHGRNTLKPRNKSAAYTSFDWQLSCMLEKHFKAIKDDRVKFYIPAGPDAIYNLYGYTYLLTHGDRMGVKGGDGQLGALGPIARGVKKVKATYSSLGIDVDTVIMGHWHQNLRLPDAIVNNCLKGWDEYSMSMRFTPTPPSQALFWTHKDLGITFETKVFVDEINVAPEPDAWITWRK